MKRTGVLAGAVLLTGAAPALVAEDAASPFHTLRLSAELARAGERAHDPWLMIAAARLRSGAEVAADGEAAGRTGEWLDQARAFGGDDPRVASVAADVAAAVRKGRNAGPRVTQQLLRGGERRSFAETFRPGRPAVVYIEGDGDTDLTLRVGAACREFGPGDVKICSWMPRKAETVTVEIGNAGRVQNRVILGMN